METVKDRMAIIGQNIRIFRKAQNFTIETLSELSGVSVSQISLLENNRADNISISRLVSIANALNRDLDSIVSKLDFEEYSDNAEYLDDEDAFINAIVASDKMKTYYPPVFQNAQISSLAELIIAFPLLDPFLFYEALCRIFGDTQDRGDYISKKLDFIWGKVPDSPAKRFAESELEKSHNLRQGIHPSFDEKMEIITDSGKEKEFDEYINLIREKYEFIRNIKTLLDKKEYF